MINAIRRDNKIVGFAEVEKGPRRGNADAALNLELRRQFLLIVRATFNFRVYWAKPTDRVGSIRPLIALILQFRFGLRFSRAAAADLTTVFPVRHRRRREPCNQPQEISTHLPLRVTICPLRRVATQLVVLLH